DDEDAADGQRCDDCQQYHQTGRLDDAPQQRAAVPLGGLLCLPLLRRPVARLGRLGRHRLLGLLGLPCLTALRARRHAAASPRPPAIMSPSVSRSVVGGTMPTMRPWNMTAMRSASAVTSSSSLEISSTATPRSRSAMSLRCTNSIEPTSSPRVGCDAISSRKG